MSNGETPLDAANSESQERIGRNSEDTDDHNLRSEVVVQFRAELLERFDRLLLKSVNSQQCFSQLDFLAAAVRAFIAAFRELFGRAAVEEIVTALSEQPLASVEVLENPPARQTILQRLREYITNPIL
jgi:hypothetical protein